jgi:hypothetical protein
MNLKRLLHRCAHLGHLMRIVTLTTIGQFLLAPGALLAGPTTQQQVVVIPPPVWTPLPPPVIVKPPPIATPPPPPVVKPLPVPTPSPKLTVIFDPNVALSLQTTMPNQVDMSQKYSWWITDNFKAIDAKGKVVDIKGIVGHLSYTPPTGGKKSFVLIGKHSQDKTTRDLWRFHTDWIAAPPPGTYPALMDFKVYTLGGIVPITITATITIK